MTLHDLKISKIINVESSKKRDSVLGDISLSYSDESGARTSEFPYEWTVKLPIYEGLNPQAIKLNLSVNLKQDSGSINFNFDWVREDRDRRDSLDQINATLSKFLDGFRIYCGYQRPH